VWVRNVTEPRVLRIDAGSVVLSAIGFSGLVYGLSSIGEAAQGDTPLPPALPIAVGVVVLALFSRRQLRLSDDALMNLHAFRVRTFTIATALMALAMMALFGALILLPLYLQDARGVSTLTTGLLLLPGGLAMGLASPFVGRLYDKVGPRPLVAPAAAVVCGALVLMSTLGQDTALGFVVLAHVVLMGALAMMFTPLMTTALGALPPHLYSHGSAIVGTLQQVGGAAGTAIFITVMVRKANAVSDAGAADPAALTQGFGLALLCGAALAAVTVVGALFLRRPAAATHATPVADLADAGAETEHAVPA
jgi:DHA2 family lincomycin resistance protein-like MFS transporter